MQIVWQSFYTYKKSAKRTIHPEKYRTSVRCLIFSCFPLFTKVKDQHYKTHGKTCRRHYHTLIEQRCCVFDLYFMLSLLYGKSYERFVYTFILLLFAVNSDLKAAVVRNGQLEISVLAAVYGSCFVCSLSISSLSAVQAVLG